MQTRFNGALTRMVKIVASIGGIVAVAAILIGQGRQVERLDRLNSNMETALAEIAALKLQGLRNEMQVQDIGQQVHAHESWATGTEKSLDGRIRDLERKRP